jgi:hypothetical protein
MIYHNFYDRDIAWIQQAVQEGIAALPAHRPLFVELYLPALQDQLEYEQAVPAALEGGAHGVALFGCLQEIPFD